MNELALELKSKITGEVRFDEGSRALYATDASNYRQVPIGVVVPKTKEDIIATVELCRKYRVPILSRGGGTSLAGQCCNVAVVMDMSKYYNQILELNVKEKFARIQPGLVLDRLRHPAERHGLTFGPDPATHNHCTLGGMMGNNSCGVHAQRWGKTQGNILEMEILLYDGTILTVGETTPQELDHICSGSDRKAQIYSGLKKIRDTYAHEIEARIPHIPRKVSGFNLEELLPDQNFNVARALVGTESTCITILEAKVKLVDNPPARSLLILGYESVYLAADHVPQINKHDPIGLEGIDDRLVVGMHKKHLHEDDISLFPEGNGWLLVEFGAESKEAADNCAKRLMAELKNNEKPPSMRLFDNPEDEKKVWLVRESGLGATARIPGQKDTWPGWEDAAVPPESVGKYLREFRALLNRFDYGCALYGHFGQGCIHTRIDFDLLTQAGIEKYLRFVNEAADLVISFGGSLSGEHGDGQSRAALLPKMFGPKLMQAFKEFKSLWDPDGMMNPGKVVDANGINDNLRLGTHYHPPALETHFKFVDDDRSFARATTRCVGVGECRRDHSGTMCPSYRVTREEMHSTRGRARLLFEMLEGDPLTKGWQEEKVKEALDLCLACKGCKGDCPVNVDMATYKAEFLSHYFKKHLRPITAYSFGLIFWWSRLATILPSIINFITQTWPFSWFAKLLAGVAQQRRVPAFAAHNFKDQNKGLIIGKNKKFSKPAGRQVILWVDTFNNFFHPQIAEAAKNVLEKLGFEVLLPAKNLCCGRPLYDYGMLTLAKKMLRRIISDLSQEIRAGIPVVALEPSCFAVFKDELKNLFPDDHDALRLNKQVFMFSEFLQKFASEKDLGALGNLKNEPQALLHVHCHQSALIDKKSDIWLLQKLGLNFKVLDAGCCGMAGSFGFEKDHYEISTQIGEKQLLPEVRALNPDAKIVTNGFSCHEQIKQLGERESLHIAEVMQLALSSNQEGRA